MDLNTLGVFITSGLLGSIGTWLISNKRLRLDFEKQLFEESRKLRNEIQKLTDFNAEWRERYFDLQGKYNELKVEYSALKAEYQELKKEFEEMLKERTK